MSCQKATEVDLAAYLLDGRADAWSEFRLHHPRCADCSREVALWRALHASLQDLEAESPAHPTEARLLAYANDREGLAAADRRAVEAHLEACRPCRNDLSVLENFDFGRLPVPATASEPAAAWRRLLEALRRWAEPLELAAARPALALGVLVLLLLPAAWMLWRGLPGGRMELGAPEAPIAGIEHPEPGTLEPPRPSGVRRPATVPEVQVAEKPPESTEPARQEVPEEESRREAVLIAEAEAEPPEVPATPPQPESPEPGVELLSEPIQIAALVPTSPLLYSPDFLPRGGVPSVRADGFIRGGEPGIPALQVLAPDHVGRTRSEAPTLHWFLAEETDWPVEFILRDDTALKPLLDEDLAGPLPAGFHAVRLADFGVRLEPDVTYRWFVALVPDPDRRSSEVISGGAIRRTEPDPELAARLDAALPQDRAHLLAGAGFWYDALDVVCGWIQAEPEEPRLRQHRASLLEQVGLAELGARGRAAEGVD